MKARQAFVSNSSTCSFSIYGAALRNSDLWDDIEEDLYEWAEAAGLKIYYNESDYCYIGLPLSAMDMNETRAEFQERVRAKLQDAIKDGTRLYFDHHEGTYLC